MTNHKYLYKFLFSSVLLGLISLLTLNSCYKDRLKIDKFSGGEWNPNLAAPLVYGEMDMNYIIGKSSEIWHEDPDGLISLVYIGEQITQVGDKVITIDNQEADTTISFVMPPGLFPGDSTSAIFLIKPTFITDANQRLDSILIKSGTMTIEVTTAINHNGYVEVIIPELTKYGITYKEKLNIPASNSSQVITRTISLADYWLIINSNGGSDNLLEEYIKVMIKRGTGSDQSPYEVKVNQKLNNIKYYQAFGYFHQYTVNIDQNELSISLFDNETKFDAIIEDARLRLVFSNSYGMPVDVVIDDFYVEKDGITENITSTLLPSFSLNYPDVSNAGEYDTTMLQFNNENSNIVDIVNFNPHKLVISGVTKTNPNGIPNPNFVLDTSKINLNAELEIPLYGRAIVYKMQDTAEVNIENDYDWSEIISMDMNIITDNYFPVEAQLQVYLADSNYVIYDSLFTTKIQIIDAAIPGPAPGYRVSSPMHNMATVNLTNENLKNLKKVENIIISASSSTYDTGNKIIKIYDDYKLKFHLSVKAEYKTDY